MLTGSSKIQISIAQALTVLVFIVSLSIAFGSYKSAFEKNVQDLEDVRKEISGLRRELILLREAVIELKAEMSVLRREKYVDSK